MKFSNRLESLKSSPIRRLVPYADKAKEKGLKVIHLNIGQPDIPTPPDFLEAVRNFDVSVLEYSDSRGIKKALETTQLYLHNYGLDFDIDEILITTGASEALLFSIMTICDPGDEILTVEPFYTNYNSIAGMANVSMVALTTKVEDGFVIPPIEEFEKIITDKTKAILLSSPCNPTGRVYTPEEMDTIVELAKKYDLFILADEVYREFNYTDRKFKSFGEYPEISQKVIILDSISKKYSACGARIGSVTTKNKEFLEHVLKLCQARLSVSTLDQIGAGAMDLVDDNYVYENRVTYKKRRDTLFNRLSSMKGVIASVPEGAFYNIVKLPVEYAEDFIIWTIENIEIDGYTTLLTPAESFYSQEGIGKNEARISYCVNEEMINRAMDVLELALEKYPKIIN